MKRSSRACAGAALSLALVSGCSGEEADGKPLSAAELKDLILAQGDVQGFRVSQPDLSDSFGRAKGGVRVDHAACEPLGYVLTGFPPGDASASALRMAEEMPRTKTLDIDVTLVSLSSYEGNGASKTMSALSSAVDGCADGFELSAENSEQKFGGVEREKAPGSGDDSLAFAVKDADEDASMSHVRVVRHGRTLATYYTLNHVKMRYGKAYDVPDALADAQAAKLK